MIEITSVLTTSGFGSEHWVCIAPHKMTSSSTHHHLSSRLYNFHSPPPHTRPPQFLPSQMTRSHQIKKTHWEKRPKPLAMAVLARAAPCPRLLLRSTTSSSRKAPQSPSPSPSPPPRHVRFMRCHAASATCLWRSPASPSPVPQHHQQRRSFRCTAGVRQDLARRNHYERLQVSPAATPGDIKK